MIMQASSVCEADNDRLDDVAPPQSATILEIEPYPIDAELAQRARILLGIRRLREFTFGDDAEIFGEPSWDILLDLFIAQHEGRQTSVSMLGGYITPSATVLRHARSLQQRGLVTRKGDRYDRRRHLIRLTPRAVDLMKRILSKADVEGPRAPIRDSCLAF